MRVVSVHEASRTLGLAIDLGTTTIVAELLNMETTVVLGSRIANNAQREFGMDVTSRMMCAEKPGGLETLRRPVLGVPNELVMTLRGETHTEAADIAAAVGAGLSLTLLRRTQWLK